MKTSSVQMINKNNIFYIGSDSQNLKPKKGRFVTTINICQEGNPVSRLSEYTEKCEKLGSFNSNEISIQTYWCGCLSIDAGWVFSLTRMLELYRASTSSREYPLWDV